jgi:hypothetical protein
MIRKNIKKYLLIVGILLVIALLTTIVINREEYEARMVVHKYLSSMKNGATDFMDCLDTSSMGEKWMDTFDVLEYKFLSVCNKEKDVPHTNMTTYDQRYYELFGKEYTSLKSYLDNEQKQYDAMNKARTDNGEEPPFKYTRTEDSLVIETPDTKNVSELYYNVTLTNSDGEIIHKRFLFMLEKHESTKFTMDYKIVNYLY